MTKFVEGARALDKRRARRVQQFIADHVDVSVSNRRHIFPCRDLYASRGSAFDPIAAQASTITSGRAAATCASVVFSPGGTTISPPQMFTNSATQGGELMRGFGHASQ